MNNPPAAKFVHGKTILDYPIDRVVPVILSPELFSADFPGPIQRIGDLPFSLAWAAVVEPNEFLYVSRDVQAHWETSGIDWRARNGQLDTHCARFPLLSKVGRTRKTVRFLL